MYENYESPLLPFLPSKVKEGVASYGLSHAGYDIRVADEWEMITADSRALFYERYGEPPVLDPKMSKDRFETLFQKFQASYVDVPAHGFVLARAIERFDIPDNLFVICLGKSTYARLGLVVNTTPFEPTWRGCPTLELSNTADVPIRVYAGEGIAQCIFFDIDQSVSQKYTGRYQDQPDRVVHASVE